MAHPTFGRAPVATGYFWAANRVLAALKDGGRLPCDLAVYPAVFLLRHAVELTFKELIAALDIVQGLPRRHLHGHDLSVLWNYLGPSLEVFDLCEWGLGEERPKAVDRVEPKLDLLVAVLHEIDPDGENARYDIQPHPEEGKIKVTLARCRRMNLGALASITADVEVWADWKMHLVQDYLDAYTSVAAT